MGGICSALATADSVEIPVPADVVWQLVTDLDRIPDILSVVESFERLKGHETGFQVGTQWRETRQYESMKVTQLKTVIDIGDDPRSLRFNVSYPDAAGIINTSTLTIKANDDQSCHLIGSFAAQSTWWSAVRDLACFPCIKAKARQYFHAELEDYADAAVALYKRQQGAK